MLCVPVSVHATMLRTSVPSQLLQDRNSAKGRKNITMAGNSNPQAQMAGLKGILRWTLEQQARGGDGTTESKEVTEEDRAWLREAMENMIDTTDHLKDCVDVLNNGHKANPVEQDDAVRQLQENALDKLMDIIDNVDFARDLGVIGGMEPLLLLLKHPKYPSLRWRAANVLGTVVQNADACQQWAYDKGALSMPSWSNCQPKLTLDVLANFFRPRKFGTRFPVRNGKIY